MKQTINKQPRRSALAFFLAAALLVGMLPVSAAAVTQSDIDAVRARKEEIAQRAEQARERLEGLKGQQAGVLELEAALNVELGSAQEALALVEEELAMYDQIIEEKTLELNAALSREQTQLERYRTRIRAMEENGNYNVLSLLIDSSSFAGFLSALDDMGDIMQSDKKLEQAYREARQEVEQLREAMSKGQLSTL